MDRAEAMKQAGSCPPSPHSQGITIKVGGASAQPGPPKETVRTSRPVPQHLLTGEAAVLTRLPRTPWEGSLGSSLGLSLSLPPQD